MAWVRPETVRVSRSRGFPIWIGWAALLLLACRLGELHVEARQRTEKKQSPWTRLASAPVALDAFPPITTRELARYSFILQLSDAQTAFMNQLYEKYVQECDVVERESATELLQEADQLSAASPGVEYAELYSSLRAAEDEFIAALTNREEQFFARLRSVLAESQLEKYPRVLDHRARAQHSEFSPEIQSARIDLSALVERAGFPEESIAQVDAVLTAYEARVTKPLVESWKAIHDSEVELTRLVMESGFDEKGAQRDGTKPEVQALRQQISEQRRTILAKRASFQLQVREVNEEFLPRIIAGLAEPQGLQIKIAYLSRVYPSSYPDPDDPRELYSGIAYASQGDEAVQSALRSLWDEYSKEYDSIAERLKKESDEWQKQMALTQASNGWQDHFQRAAHLRQQRADLNASIVKRVAAVLTPEVRERWQFSIDEWRQAFELHRAQEQAKPKQYVQPD